MLISSEREITTNFNITNFNVLGLTHLPRVGLELTTSLSLALPLKHHDYSLLWREFKCVNVLIGTQLLLE
jgi:hypothetical protein